MQKWEYKYLTLDGRTWVDSATNEALGKYNERIHLLNALGEAGWELVSDTNSIAICTLTFKRPK